MSPGQTSDPVWTRVRILIVEDDPSLRDLLTIHIRSMQLWEVAEIVGCGSVAGAEMALRSGPRFDAIVLDLGLPNGQGLEVIYRLSRAQAFPPAIIVLTGMDFDVAHEVQGIREGACTWVRKSELIKSGGFLDWEPLERAVGYSLARRDWLGPMLIERSRRIAAESEAVSSG